MKRLNSFLQQLRGIWSCGCRGCVSYRLRGALRAVWEQLLLGRRGFHSIPVASPAPWWKLWLRRKSALPEYVLQGGVWVPTGRQEPTTLTDWATQISPVWEVRWHVTCGARLWDPERKVLLEEPEDESR